MLADCRQWIVVGFTRLSSINVTRNDHWPFSQLDLQGRSQLTLHLPMDRVIGALCTTASHAACFVLLCHLCGATALYEAAALHPRTGA
jgi:hypothetical protein